MAPRTSAHPTTQTNMGARRAKQMVQESKLPGPLVPEPNVSGPELDQNRTGYRTGPDRTGYQTG